MDKHTVSHVLEQIAAFLELVGDDSNRGRAFHDAARTVGMLSGPIDEEMRSGALASTRGVGSEALDVIRELLEKGHSTLANSLREAVPEELAEMLHISGLGIAKVRQIHQQLGIKTITELEAAARDGRLATLPRFGAKTAQNVLKGIQFLRAPGPRRLYHHALKEAEALRDAVCQLEDVQQVEIGGAIRRCCETIQDIELVVAHHGDDGTIATRLTEAPGISESLVEESGTVRLRFASGSVVNVRLTTAEAFGTTLVRATGSAQHLEELGWLPDSMDEHTVYGVCGMQFVPPELREGLGEVALARDDRLPRLVQRDDLRGFLHCHTNYSDGTTTIEEWAHACTAAGYEWMGITDHSHAAPYAGGLSSGDLERQHAEVDAVNAKGMGCHVLKGIEADILPDGSLDFSDEILSRFEFVIGSIHSVLELSEAEMTARVLRAMENPHFAIFGHPTGRLLLSRDGYALDLDAVFARAADLQVAIEVNADPQRLDLDWRLVRKALEQGVMISIGADAHNAAAIGNVDFGLGIARKGMATRSAVLNTMSLDGFLKHIQERIPR